MIYETLAAMADRDDNLKFDGSPTVDELVTYLIALKDAGVLQTSYEYLTVGSTKQVDPGFQSLKHFLKGLMDRTSFSVVDDEMIAEVDARVALYNDETELTEDQDAL